MKTSSVEFISRSPNPSPMKSESSTDSPLVSMEIPLRTAYGQNGRCGMQPKPTTVFARRRIKSKLKLLDIRAEKEQHERRGERERCASEALHLLNIIVKLICKNYLF
ncbi:hypothetical protein TNCV_864861 [Trichonephila clavipes]|nr:hypothetical protein TNCV_864861 [Trichonephila clavipes]